MARSLSAAGTDKISIASGFNSLLSATATTLSVWLYSDLSQAYGPLWGLSETVTNTGLKIYIKSNGKLAIYTAIGSNYDGTGTYTISANTWAHIVGTGGTGLNPTGYVNGLVDGNDSSTGLTFSGATFASYLGHDNSVGNHYYNGLLADACAWNAVLSTAEIAALANGARPFTVRPGNIIGNFPLDGLSSPEPDLSGNANNGTLTGTTAANGPPVAMFTPRWPSNIDIAAPSFIPAWAMGTNLPVLGTGHF